MPSSVCTSRMMFGDCETMIVPSTSPTLRSKDVLNQDHSCLNKRYTALGELNHL
jgi:hypothetical protein